MPKETAKHIELHHSKCLARHSIFILFICFGYLVQAERYAPDGWPV